MRQLSSPRWTEAVPWVVVGMLLGISFFAQPIKFLTPGLSNAQLVSVGATIFEASHLMQWTAFALLFVSVVPGKSPASKARLYLLAAAGTLIGQQVFVMPTLIQRLVSLNEGRTSPNSPHHLAYVVLELLKLSALVLLARLHASQCHLGEVQ
ncbi:hypothetical protein [Paucibacter sp. DJ2R-2]|uniref:hypothetical protein n=1 Tax=Paucibacter sp. DJ2R-2 TaxID=2893558 RepID=UPI0021E4AD73|nr:hypothetical protein [Paucibacter sp. DJ2R-2]MCV2438675.1 hypothetical protein [Paucibacter sp. DJ2R-2]